MMTTETRRTHTVRAFEDRAGAEQAINDLRGRGWSDEEIGFAMRGEQAPEGASDAAERTATGAVTGAATGGLIGGLGAAAISLLIPGVGPIIGGGILATVLGGAAVGAAAGGLLGALTGLGVPEEEAQFYDSEFRSGRAVVTARQRDDGDDAATILHRHGGYDHTRGSTGGTATPARTVIEASRGGRSNATMERHNDGERRDTNEGERSDNRASEFGTEESGRLDTSRGTTPVRHGSVGPVQQQEESAEMITGESTPKSQS